MIKIIQRYNDFIHMASVQQKVMALLKTSLCRMSKGEGVG